MNICRGIRGAITVDNNSRKEILDSTRELLLKIIEENQIKKETLAAVWFTTTVDLNAEFPAVAARELGWDDVALLCGHEMDVPGSLNMCIRVLILVNTEKSNDKLKHIYLKNAEHLKEKKK